MLTPEQEIETLKAKLASLEEANKLSFKVSEKGGLSVYGLGRFPVTLYYAQWLRLIEAIPQLQAFLAAHKGEFKQKS